MFIKVPLLFFPRTTHSRDHASLDFLHFPPRASSQQTVDTMDVPFPTDVREFDSDERISFSKLDNKFIAVHDDGTEFEFDAELKKWVPTEEEPLDEDLDDLREYSGTPAGGDALQKKRKHEEENGDEVSWQRPRRGYPVLVRGARTASPARFCCYRILTAWSTEIRRFQACPQQEAETPAATQAEHCRLRNRPPRRRHGRRGPRPVFPQGWCHRGGD